MTVNVDESRLSISQDVMLSALANDRRRAVFQVLTTTDDLPIGFDALSDAVADLVCENDTTSPTAKQKQNVRAELHHVHLPKLDEHGLLTYEADEMQITTGDTRR